jgi:hypothetical protein
VLLKKHCVTALLDVRAEVGTTVFESGNENVSRGDVAFVSAWYVSCCAVNARAKGLLVLLIVRLARMPDVGVLGVVLVA